MLSIVILPHVPLHVQYRSRSPIRSWREIIHRVIPGDDPSTIVSCCAVRPSGCGVRELLRIRHRYGQYRRIHLDDETRPTIIRKYVPSAAINPARCTLPGLRAAVMVWLQRGLLLRPDISTLEIGLTGTAWRGRVTSISV